MSVNFKDFLSCLVLH